MKRRRKFADAEQELRPVGRPAGGDFETKLTARIPTSLAGAMADFASSQGITVSEAWRRAAQAFLGLENRLPEES